MTSAGKHRRPRPGLPPPARAVGRAGKSVLLSTYVPEDQVRVGDVITQGDGNPQPDVCGARGARLLSANPVALRG